MDGGRDQRTTIGDNENVVSGSCDCCGVVAADKPRSAPRSLKGGRESGALEGRVVKRDNESTPPDLERQIWKKAMGRGSTKNSGCSRRRDRMASGSRKSRHVEKHSHAIRRRGCPQRLFVLPDDRR